jgi:hypothetical protein
VLGRSRGVGKPMGRDESRTVLLPVRERSRFVKTSFSRVFDGLGDSVVTKAQAAKFARTYAQIVTQIQLYSNLGNKYIWHCTCILWNLSVSSKCRFYISAVSRRRATGLAYAKAANGSANDKRPPQRGPHHHVGLSNANARHRSQIHTTAFVRLVD